MSIPSILEGLRGCLETRLAGSSFCGGVRILPGATPALDGCWGDCTGQAWVRLVRAWTSMSFPAADTNPRLGPGLLVMQAEVGIARCMPPMQQHTGAPDPDEVAAVMAQVLADMPVLRRTLSCCDRPGDIVLGPYLPFGPQGGLVGGVWSATYEVG